MNMIIDIILKEKARIEYMLKRYRKIIDELPKVVLLSIAFILF